MRYASERAKIGENTDLSSPNFSVSNRSKFRSTSPVRLFADSASEAADTLSSCSLSTISRSAEASSAFDASLKIGDSEVNKSQFKVN